MDLNRTALLLVDIQKAFDDIEYWGSSRQAYHINSRIYYVDLLKIESEF